MNDNAAVPSSSYLSSTSSSWSSSSSTSSAETLHHDRPTSSHRRHTTTCAWVPNCVSRWPQRCQRWQHIVWSPYGNNVCSVRPHYRVNVPPCGAQTLRRRFPVTGERLRNVCAPMPAQRCPMCGRMLPCGLNDVKDRNNVWTVRPHSLG